MYTAGLLSPGVRLKGLKLSAVPECFVCIREKYLEQRGGSCWKRGMGQCYARTEGVRRKKRGRGNETGAGQRK